jgi:hypothetical protein
MASAATALRAASTSLSGMAPGAAAGSRCSSTGKSTYSRQRGRPEGCRAGSEGLGGERGGELLLLLLAGAAAPLLLLLLLLLLLSRAPSSRVLRARKGSADSSELLGVLEQCSSTERQAGLRRAKVVEVGEGVEGGGGGGGGGMALSVIGPKRSFVSCNQLQQH